MKEIQEKVNHYTRRGHVEEEHIVEWKLEGHVVGEESLRIS
jgi:hypothetical protein